MMKKELKSLIIASSPRTQPGGGGTEREMSNNQNLGYC